MDLNPKKMQEMLAQAQQQAQELQDQMANTIVEASAGGGTVTVKMNGQKRLIEIRIEAEVMQGGDVEMLQDLIMAAINEAGRKAEQAMQSRVGGMLGGMGLPGLF
jgi:nucleoid-associated protein EbfC